MDELIKLILQSVDRDRKKVPNFQKITDIYENNTRPYVLASLQAQLSPESYKIASNRVPGINLLRRINKKLSKVYIDAPERSVEDPRDQEFVDAYKNKIQNVMKRSEEILNLHKHLAIEPYFNKAGSIDLRILLPEHFTVISLNSENPYQPDVLVKYMGKAQRGGKVVEELHCFTSDFIFKLFTNGEILDFNENPYKRLPFIYLNATANQLRPDPDLDSFENAVLVPVLLSDLNYAIQFLSHSIMYGVDVETSTLTGSPDSFWSIKSSDKEGSKPQIGTLTPSVDVEKVLSLITFTVQQWLETRGVRSGTAGQLSADMASSGISKIIDEANTDQVAAENRSLLSQVEKTLWKLIAQIHNILIQSAELEFSRGVDNNLNVSLTFPIQQSIKDPREERENLKFQLESGLISKKAAMRKAHPSLTEEQILALLEEIDIESKRNSPTSIGNNEDNGETIEGTINTEQS